MISSSINIGFFSEFFLALGLKLNFLLSVEPPSLNLINSTFPVKYCFPPLEATAWIREEPFFNLVGPGF